MSNGGTIDRTNGVPESNLNTKVLNAISRGVSVSQQVTAGADQVVTFPHGLGRVPILVNIQLSPDESFDDVYLVQWPHNLPYSRGPVCIHMDTQNVYLEFTTGHLFGGWSYSTNNWRQYDVGYFRVIAF